MYAYIEYNGMLISGNEWAGGSKPSAKETATRRREISRGEAIQITDESDFYTHLDRIEINRKT